MLNYLRGVHEELLANVGGGVCKCATKAAPPASQQDPCSLTLLSSSRGSEQWLGRTGWSHALRPPREASVFLDVFHTSGVN